MRSTHLPLLVFFLSLLYLSGCGNTEPFPTNVANISNTADSHTPAIAVDTSGNINLAWRGGTPGEIYYSRFTDTLGTGIAYSAVNKNISNTVAGDSVTPAIALDGSSFNNVVWNEGGAIYFSRFSFDAPAPSLNISQGTSSTPTTVVDSSGNIDIVWEKSGQIFFSRSTDGGLNFLVPKNISGSSTTAIKPSLGVDGSGNINVVWEDGGNILFSRSTDGGNNFAAQYITFLFPGTSHNPKIAVQSSGPISVVWDDTSLGGNSEAFFSRAATTNFSSPVNVSQNFGSSSNPAVAVDSSGNINVVWQDNGSGNLEVLFARSTNNGASFSAGQNISNTPTATSVTPAVAVDSLGNTNVAWQEGSPGEILFRRSTNGGASFSASQNISNTFFPSSITPTIAVDSSGNIDVAWNEGAGIVFSRSTNNGSSFSSQNIAASGLTPAFAVDASGNINLVWNDGKILFGLFTANGATVLPPKDISSTVAATPAIVVDTRYGYIYSVWQDNTAGTPGEIFFSRSINGGSSFSSGQPVSNMPAVSSITPAIAVDNTTVDTSTDGNVYVVWNEGGNIVFSRSMNNGFSFSGSQTISTTGTSVTPAIAVDSSPGPTNGYIYVVWNEGGNIVFSRSTNGGLSFSSSQFISTSGTSITPAIAVNRGTGSTGHNIGVVWQEGSPGEIVLSRSTDGGDHFSSGQNISNTSGSSITPAIALNASGRTRVVWEDDKTGIAEIFFAAGD